MAATKSLNRSKILDIFKSMDHQNVPIDSSAAEKWLYSRYGTENSETENTKIIFDDKKAPLYYPILNQPCVANKVFEDSKTNTKWREWDAPSKTATLHKFAVEIDKNSDLICQLELLFRNILPKDTKKYGIPILKDYLQYYANWTETATNNLPTDTNVILCSTSIVFSLAEIGFFLGSALARGSSLIFYGEDTLSVLLDFLVELAVKAGIPEGTIKSFYGSDGTFRDLTDWQIYKNIRIGDVARFNYKKVLVTPHLKGSMVVFNDADLDSVCESAVAAIWSCCGLLPWAIDTVLVQEDIFVTFVAKLKDRIKKLQFGDKPTSSDDVSFYHLSNWKAALDKLIKEAKAQGIEVYQAKDTKRLSPTLFVGGKVAGNRVMSEHMLQVPTGTILAFRTPKEAASLANNSQQGLAVSLWTQNISLANEVVRKLDVGTVWVNCHGIIRAGVGFTTRKYEGIGYIGGPEGLYEFEELSSSTTEVVETKVSGALTAAKKAQESWGKLPFNARAEKLSKIVQDNQCPPKLAKAFYGAVKELSCTNTTQTIENFDVKSYRDPVGVVVVNKNDDTRTDIIISSLLLGNAVLFVEGDQIKKEMDVVSKHLPSGVLGNIAPNELTTAFDALKQSVVILGKQNPVKRSLHCQKHYDTPENIEEIVKFVLRRCSVSKNVWTDIESSF